MKKIVFILCFVANFIYSQEYYNFAYAMFFGRQPSAKAEAMGKGLIASEDGANSSFFNPASISFTRGLNLSYNHSDPYYLLNEANYQYFGISTKLNKKHAVSISKFSLNYKLGVLHHSAIEDYVYRLNYAFAPKEDLSIGLNVNYYVLNPFLDEASIDKVLFDLGVIKEFVLNESLTSFHKVSIAAVVKNVLKNNMHFGYYSEVLPSSLEAGISYSGKFKGEIKFYDLDFFNFLLNTEYRELLYHQKGSAFIIGTEFKFFELLAIRTGYFTESNLGNSESNKESISDFTYGGGIAIPLYKMTQSIPLEIKLDLMSKKQPSYINNFDDWDNMTVYNLMVNWVF